MMKRFSLQKFLLMVGASIKGFFIFEESAEGKKRRKELFVLAGIFCALVIGAILVGVSDNLPSIALCYLAAITLIGAVTRTWKRTKMFLILLGVSVGGFIVFVVLHNVFYGLTMLTSHITALSRVMEVFHVTFFIIALFLCPAAFLVGAVGSIVRAIKGRRSQTMG